MTKLPSKAELQAAVEEQHQRDFERDLYHRDHTLLDLHYPLLFRRVVGMVSEGIDPETIRSWAEKVVRDEPRIIHR